MSSLPILAQMVAASMLATAAPVTGSAVLAVPADAPTAPVLEAAAATQIKQHPGHYHEGEFGKKYLKVEEDIRCNCGCGLDVHRCQYQMQCGTSPEWSQRIKRELEAGKTPEAVEAGFVADFGPTVLVSPPAEGFNLVGYLLPSIAIITAGIFVGLVIRGGARDKEEVAPVTDLSDEDRARLDEAMKRLEEEESPDW
ncbi:MAG: cytochrome c-type biogenesis protein CcmH [Gemmatimonadota bacterium]